MIIRVVLVVLGWLWCSGSGMLIWLKYIVMLLKCLLWCEWVVGYWGLLVWMLVVFLSFSEVWL